MRAWKTRDKQVKVEAEVDAYKENRKPSVARNICVAHTRTGATNILGFALACRVPVHPWTTRSEDGRTGNRLHNLHV
jgi:hypothetical protein